MNGRRNGEIVQEVVATNNERLVGAYSTRTLQIILSTLHQDGLVVLKGIIDVEHVDALNKAMCEGAEKTITNPGTTYNHNVRCAFVRCAHTGVILSNLELQQISSYGLQSTKPLTFTKIFTSTSSCSRWPMREVQHRPSCQ